MLIFYQFSILCSMMLLKSCLGTNFRHILKTAALDGETDLKTRVIPSACMGIDLELLHKIKARDVQFLHAPFAVSATCLSLIDAV